MKEIIFTDDNGLETKHAVELFPTHDAVLVKLTTDNKSHLMTRASFNKLFLVMSDFIEDEL